MKKIYTFIMLLAVSSMTFMSCGSSKKANKGILGNSGTMGGTIAKTVATAVGVILLSKIITSVLGTLGNSSSFASLKQSSNYSSLYKEDTKINSFANNDFMKTALQVIVAEKYKIPLTTVSNNFTNLKTMGDLATFIGQNGDAKVLAQIK